MSTIAIRPYSNASPNMGLEKYDQVLFEGTSNTVPIWAREDVAGSPARWITGLNEFAPELLKLDEETKAAKIKEIRTAVAFLEGALASNRIDVKDKDFWSKVKQVRPDNHKFWHSISVTLSNNPSYLDPTEPEDLIKIFAIEAGGVPEVAPSYEAAKNGIKKYRFYLDKTEATVKEKTKSSINEKRAGAILVELLDNNFNKLFYVTKAIDPNSSQYKRSTPPEVFFQNMNEYIDGIIKGTAKKNPANAENFIKIAQLDMETLKLRAIVKDASFHGFLQVRSNQIYEALQDTPLGYNITEVVECLKNPLNDAILKRLMDKVEKFWNL